MEHMGHTVNFRACKPFCKEEKMIQHPPEKRLIFKNTHEASVDPESRRLARRIRQTVRRTGATGEANSLTGPVFCADCGAKMYNRKRGGNALRAGMKTEPENRLFPNDHYNCSSYMLTYRRTERKCCSRYVTAKGLRVLPDTVKTVSVYARPQQKSLH